MENAGAEHFVAAQRLEIVLGDSSHGDGVSGRVEDLDGITLFPVPRHMMVDNDDHVATAQVVLWQVMRQHCFCVEVEGHTTGKVVSVQSSVSRDQRNSHVDTESAEELKHRRTELLSRKTGPSQTPVAGLRAAGGGDKMAIMFDWSDCTGVTTSPDTVSGAFVFRGTRVPVKALFENLEDGATVDDFIQWFGDTRRG